MDQYDFGVSDCSEQVVRPALVVITYANGASNIFWGAMSYNRAVSHRASFLDQNPGAKIIIQLFANEDEAAMGRMGAPALSQFVEQ